MSKIILIIFLTFILFPPKYKIKNNIKIIIYLIGIIFILQNNEGFGTGIDGEALRNIASLYNNADGTLKVKNLKATGNIVLDGDLNASGNINMTGDILKRINGPANNFGIYGDGYITTKNNMVINGDITTSGVTTKNVNISGGNLKLTKTGTPGVGGEITGYYGSSPTYTIDPGGITTHDITATGTVKTNTIRTNVKTKPFDIYGPQRQQLRFHSDSNYIDYAGDGMGGPYLPDNNYLTYTENK